MLEMLVHVIMRARARAYSLSFFVFGGGNVSARTWKFSMANIGTKISDFFFVVPVVLHVFGSHTHFMVHNPQKSINKS